MKTLRGCENGLCGRESLDRPPVGCSRDEEARECGRAPQSLMIIVSADHILVLVVAHTRTPTLSTQYY